ncbi:MAG: hypothetical protein U5K54_20315 [Cytophagales bacterium]|nr:hypothetical protein [Cytophagales bacterium]
MKKKLKSSLLGITFILLTAITGFSQCKEVVWPENKAKAEESVALYGDAMKQQELASSCSPFSVDA